MPGIDSYDKLILHFDGDDDSTTITDSSLSSHTITAYGNAKLDTGQYKFGASSCIFDGNGDYVGISSIDDFSFGTGDFTIDFWVRLNTTGVVHSIYSALENTDYHSIYISIGSDNKLNFKISSANISWDTINISISPALSANTWYHVAIVRSSLAFKLFLNGNLAVSLSNSLNVASPTDGIAIGYNSAVGTSLDGWLDEFRVSKGIARWTSSFTPYTSSYSDDTTGTLELSSTKPSIDISCLYYYSENTAPLPICSFVGGESVYGVFIESPKPILSMDSRYTTGSLELIQAIPSVEIDVNKTIGSFICESVIPESEIESTYTIGYAILLAIHPESSIRSTYTSGRFEEDAPKTTATIQSTYTIGRIEIEVPLPYSDVVSSYTIGRIEAISPQPELSLSSTYTRGNLSLSVRKPSITYSFKFGSVGWLSVETPEIEIDISGFTSSSGRLNIEAPAPKTRRF